MKRVREWLLVGAGALILVALACSGSDSTGPSAAPPLGTIAFVSARDGNQEIYVMNADGSGVSRLTNTPATDIDPAWSPDGRRIAFASDGDGTHRIYDIYVMNADGSGVTRLSDSGREPAWKPLSVLEAGMKARQPVGVTGHSETPMPAPCLRQRAPRRRYESKPTVAAHYRRRAARLSRGLH